MAIKRQVRDMGRMGYVPPSVAAKWLGFHPASVTRIVAEGRVECTRAGRFIYISVESLRVYLGPAGAGMLPENDFPIEYNMDGSLKTKTLLQQVAEDRKVEAEIDESE